jgi:hypothetical protein
MNQKKLCNFYANKKVCPFERVGCKFKHAKCEKSNNVEEREVLTNDEEHEKEKDNSGD